MTERLEVSLLGEKVGWVTRGSRRERVEFEWLDGYTPGPVTLTESNSASPATGRSSSATALAIDRSFDHRRISAAHLIREAESWSALRTGEAEQVVTTTLTDFAKALDHVPVPQGGPAAAAAQLAWNVERLQAGAEIGERSSGYRRRRRRP